jgi:PAC2 family
MAGPGDPGDPGDLIAPTLIAAFDGWVDAGSAATVALAQLLDDAPAIATFDTDALFDYRARRPTLDIVDGRLALLTWPELAIRRVTIEARDLLVLAGPEPDDRWQAFSAAVLEIARRVGVVEWISLGAIPAAVPHTRDVPILGTTSEPGRLRGNVQPGPSGLLRVPAAAISVLEMAMAEGGVPAVGYFAQVPHYVSGRRWSCCGRSVDTSTSPCRLVTSRRKRDSFGRGWTRPPRSRRRRAPTSSGSRAWSTRSGCRRATN